MNPIIPSHELTEEEHAAHFRVSIFGSARLPKEDPLYKEIFEIAKVLAEKIKSYLK